MTFKAKIPGTRYSLELVQDTDEDQWSLELKINNATEDTILVKNISLREIKKSVDDIISGSHAEVNPFQLELLAKDLYGKASGDEDLSKHKQDMKEIEEKRKMTQDGSLQSSIVSEYKQSLGVKDEKTPMKSGKQIKKPGEKEKKVAEAAMARPEMKSMVSEISERVDPAPQTSATRDKKPNVGREDDVDQIDTRVSSVDVDDLIAELIDTKRRLQQDLDRVNQRMKKIDNIISKIGSISSKL